MIARMRWVGLSLLAFVVLAVLDGLLLALVTTVAGWGDAPHSLMVVVGWTSFYAAFLFWLGLVPALVFLIVRRVFMPAAADSWWKEAARGLGVCAPTFFLVMLLGSSNYLNPIPSALISTIAALPIWPGYGLAVAAIRERILRRAAA